MCSSDLSAWAARTATASADRVRLAEILQEYYSPQAGQSAAPEGVPGHRSQRPGRVRRRDVLLGMRSAFDITGRTLLDIRLAPPPRRFLPTGTTAISDEPHAGPGG